MAASGGSSETSNVALEVLADAPGWVAARAVSRPDATPALLAALADHPDDEARWAAVSHPACPADVLVDSAYGQRRERPAALCNPSTPAWVLLDVLEAWAEDRSAGSSRFLPDLGVGPVGVEAPERDATPGWVRRNLFGGEHSERELEALEELSGRLLGGQTIGWIAQAMDAGLRAEVAANPAVPVGWLAGLGSHTPDDLLIGALRHPACPSSVARIAARHRSPLVRERAAVDGRLPERMLLALAAEEPRLRASVARNPHATAAVLVGLVGDGPDLDDDSGALAHEVLAHPACPVELQERLDPTGVAGRVHRPDCPPELLGRVVESGSFVASVAASHPACPTPPLQAVLDRVERGELGMAEEGVIRGMLRNPGLPVELDVRLHRWAATLDPRGLVFTREVAWAIVDRWGLPGRASSLARWPLELVSEETRADLFLAQAWPDRRTARRALELLDGGSAGTFARLVDGLGVPLRLEAPPTG